MEDWTFILTWGDDLDLYGKDNERKVVERETGKVVLEYTKTN